MCYRLGCPFGKSYKAPDDGMIRILIFGATGMTGTAVLAAALTCIWFRISIFTRGNDIEIMRDMRKKPLARIVEGDMFNYDTVRDAMTDIDAVFFSTTYWDTMRVECEMEQGQNIVQAAMAAGVKHIIYVGTPYCHLYAPEKCKYLLGKEKVEALVVASGLPYTILHLGFYYENLLSVFRPHKVGRKSYALALPMGDVPLNCGSVLDFGRCIAKIMLRPTQNIFKTIRLCTAYHTVAELAKILDDHFEDLTFFDPKIPLSVYRAFDFRGSAELASMFAFYQSIQVQWSTDKTHEYFSGCVGFKEWVTDQDQYIVEAITEIKEEIFPKSLSIYLPKTEEVGYRHLTRKKSNKFRLSEPTGRIPRVILNAENFLQRYVFRYFSNLRKNSPEDSDLDEKQKLHFRVVEFRSPSKEPPVVVKERSDIRLNVVPPVSERRSLSTGDEQASLMLSAIKSPNPSCISVANSERGNSVGSVSVKSKHFLAPTSELNVHES